MTRGSADLAKIAKPDGEAAQSETTALDEATTKGWIVVDIKNDWKVIYPFENEVRTGATSGTLTDDMRQLPG